MKINRLEQEIELIENDDEMTNKEKADAIHELEKDYEHAMREAAQEAYDKECEGW